MNDIKSDINCTGNVLKGRFAGYHYDQVYFSSNEDLQKIFLNFDFKDKNVLSVLASGDQAFYFCNADVSKIDFFDINKLTLYYYYLRKWTIEYLGRFYPNQNINNDYICNLLTYVKPSSEEERSAYNYWQEFIHTFNSDMIQRLFIWSDSLLYNAKIMRNNNTLKDKIQDGSKFYNIDIADNIDMVRDKYDVIYTSNIIDYVGDNHLHIYRNNLYNLLNDNGIVIGAHANARKFRLGNYVEQVEVFLRYFDYYELPEVRLTASKRIMSPGYYFVKK